MNTTDHASWIGKSKSVNDALRPEQAQLLSATIGHDRTIENGSTLPALWHWVYFQEVSQIDQLGRDGHASKGEFLPPIDLPRRMWAGGRLDYQRHAKIGERLTKTSTIKDIKDKTGKTGQLCFVTVRHECSRKSTTLFTVKIRKTKPQLPQLSRRQKTGLQMRW